jgi:hypothetical protein
MNNIFLQEDSAPITGLDSNLGIVWTNNLWSKSPQTQAQGTGSIVIDPQLVKAGATGPGALTPEYFKISITSPARGRALSLLEVVEDFFKTPRGTLPDIGGHQYVATPGSLIDPPTNLKVIGVVD